MRMLKAFAKLTLGASVLAVMSVSAASAAELSQMWSAPAAPARLKHMIDLWNSGP